MRQIPVYIHQRADWPAFSWKEADIILPLATVRNKQGRLLGRLEGLGFALREEATLETLTLDVTKSSEIEGENLPADQVRSSIAKRLGIVIAGEVPTSRNVEGVVEMMLDATQNYDDRLTDERLFGWHASLFPSGKRVHFEAPKASHVQREMKRFLKWFNAPAEIDPVLKAAVAHLWFVTIHPFEDGNGRIARAIADMQLARADESRQRFYSMSAQIQKDRNAYYNILERTQKGNLDITQWLSWFFECLDRAIASSDKDLSRVIHKAKFWDNHQFALNERQRKMLNRMLDGFEGNVTSSKWAKITKCSTDTALRDIQDLVEKNILEKEEGGGRSTSYKIL